MKLSYIPSPTAPKFGQSEAAKVADQLLKVEKRFGSISPKALVTVASDPKNYLHKYFTWDDVAAAEKYRTWEARALIASVFVVTEDNGKVTQPVRAFVNVHTQMDEEEDSEPAYVSMSQTISRPDYQSQVLNYAVEQLKSWRRRFGNFDKFFKVAKAIDDLEL